MLRGWLTIPSPLCKQTFCVVWSLITKISKYDVMRFYLEKPLWLLIVPGPYANKLLVSCDFWFQHEHIWWPHTWWLFLACVNGCQHNSSLFGVAQRRESPSVGDGCKLRLTPLPPSEFTPSLLPGHFRGYLLRIFYWSMGFTGVRQLRGTCFCRLSTMSFRSSRGSRASANRASAVLVCKSGAKI